MYRFTIIWINTDFSWKTIEDRRHWNKILKVLTEENCQASKDMPQRPKLNKDSVDLGNLLLAAQLYKKR